MAERKLDILSKTEEPKEDPKDDKIKGVAVGLRKSEWERMSKLADELGQNRHALAVWVLRDFLTRCESGWRPETVKEVKIKLR